MSSTIVVSYSKTLQYFEPNTEKYKIANIGKILKSHIWKYEKHSNIQNEQIFTFNEMESRKWRHKVEKGNHM